MKKLNFAGLAILFCLFITPFLSNSKGAEVEKVVVSIEGQFEFIGVGTKVTTPSSNFLKTYKFKVSEDILEQFDFGIYANKLIRVELELGPDEILTGDGFLNKAGVLTVSIHRNGAGGRFPKGWF